MTYWLNVLIRDFVKGQSGRFLKENGAMLVTLFHEVAHALRRISCDTGISATNVLIPKRATRSKSFK